MDGFSVKKRIAFITTSRADYTKIQPFLDFFLEYRADKVDLFLYVTGGHVLSDFGQTAQFIKQDYEDKNISLYFDTAYPQTDMVAQTTHVLSGFSHYMREQQIDCVFIHGDRTDAMAATLGVALNNLPMIHIEAGDISGALDEALRHSITKLSHKFFVIDEHAKKIVRQLGENEKDIFIVGNSSLAAVSTEEISFERLKQQYDIFDMYGIVLYHPVTTLSLEQIKERAQNLMTALDESGYNYVILSPNHERGSQEILSVYEPYRNHKRFRFFKSFRHEEFETLLKQAHFLIGNSSCGIMEAPVYGVPVVNVGIRQQGRDNHLMNTSLLTHVPEDVDMIKEVLQTIPSSYSETKPTNARSVFMERLDKIIDESFWDIPTQKIMREI